MTPGLISYQISARYAEFFDLILKQDNFAPLIVSCKEEELEIFTLFPFNSEEVNGNFGALESPGHAPNNYPKKLPFSRMVLRIFGRMKEFIDEYFLYFSGSDLNRIQRDDQARRAVISLIKRALRQTIKTKLDQNNVGLNELMQVSFYNMRVLVKRVLVVNKRRMPRQCMSRALCLYSEENLYRTTSRS